MQLKEFILKLSLPSENGVSRPAHVRVHRDSAPLTGKREGEPASGHSPVPRGLRSCSATVSELLSTNVAL